MKDELKSEETNVYVCVHTCAHRYVLYMYNINMSPVNQLRMK